MIVFNKQLIDLCVAKHASSQKAMNKLVEILMQCECRTHRELLEVFPKADYVGNNRYVFDVKGNHFRVVCVVVFIHGVALVRFAGTHAEYDKIQASTI